MLVLVRYSLFERLIHLGYLDKNLYISFHYYFIYINFQTLLLHKCSLMPRYSRHLSKIAVNGESIVPSYQVSCVSMLTPVSKR